MDHLQCSKVQTRSIIYKDSFYLMSLYKDFNVERQIVVWTRTLEIFFCEDKVVLCGQVSNHGGELGGINVFKNMRL